MGPLGVSPTPRLQACSSDPCSSSWITAPPAPPAHRPTSYGGAEEEGWNRQAHVLPPTRETVWLGAHQANFL